MSFVVPIHGYPFANYDTTTKMGCVVDYYPYGTLESDDWRSGSHSPEILDFKEGKDHNIEYWIDPFKALLKHVFTTEKLESALLVPVPSSMPKTDPRYNMKPKPKPAQKDDRNRDDRLIIFCSKICGSHSKLRPAELIERTKYKKEKLSLSVEDHVKTLKLANAASNLGSFSTAILVDDVRNDGNTFEACEEVLRKGKQKFSKILKLSLAQARDPGDFRDIRSGV